MRVKNILGRVTRINKTLELGRNVSKKLKRNQCGWKAGRKGKGVFGLLKQAATYQAPSQESFILFLYALALSGDPRKNVLSHTIYPQTHDALLFQMDLGKRLQEPYVSKFLMSMITAQSFLLKVKPSALPLHRSLSLRETLMIILMGLLLPSVLLTSHQGQLTYGISDQ